MIQTLMFMRIERDTSRIGENFCWNIEFRDNAHLWKDETNRFLTGAGKRKQVDPCRKGQTLVAMALEKKKV